ncbi:MAG: hypothetical protein WCO94_15255 [Verrucomicrobiota bacterium]
MKVSFSLLVLLATAFLGTARAGESPLAFVLPLDSGLELSGKVGITNSADGTWKPLKEMLDKTDDGFQGTLVTLDGKEIKIESHYKKAGAKWMCSIKWESESETPSVFIGAEYVFSQDQLNSATMSSRKDVVSFVKMIEKIPTGNALANVSELTLGPIDGANLLFTLPERSLVEALLLGEKFYVRTFLTPTNEALPASGTLEWTVEKQ